MTRKDFQLIADTILAIDVNGKTREQIATAFAESLRFTNPRFDMDRFIKAATEGK